MKKLKEKPVGLISPKETNNLNKYAILFFQIIRKYLTKISLKDFRTTIVDLFKIPQLNQLHFYLK